MTGRSFKLSPYIQRCCGSGSQRLVLRQYPIISVEYIKNPETGEVLPPASYDFEESGNIGVLYREAGWPTQGYFGGLSGDEIAQKRYLEVSYHAGYLLPWEETEEQPTTLPSDLEQVVWGIVEQEFLIRNNGAQGLSAFSLSDVSWTFDKQPRPGWLDILKRYERI